MKVTAILKGRKDDLGRQNIVIRISEGQNRTYKKLGIKIPKEQFSSGLVRSSHPLHKSYNIKIKEELLKIEKAGKFRIEFFKCFPVDAIAAFYTVYAPADQSCQLQLL